MLFWSVNLVNFMFCNRENGCNKCTVSLFVCAQLMEMGVVVEA